MKSLKLFEIKRSSQSNYMNSGGLLLLKTLNTLDHKDLRNFCAFSFSKRTEKRMRKLKDHEKKLLKKVDFFQWKSDSSMREIKVMRRYHLQDREDYIKYHYYASNCLMLF